MHQPHFGVRLQQGDLLFELRRRPQVVRVQNRQILAPRLGDAAVQRRVGAPIRLHEEPYAVAVALQNLHRAVRAAVVHDHDFVVAVGLVEHTLQGGGQVWRVIVAGYQHADSGRHRRALYPRGVY
jgi:hypothetical protein